MKLKESEWTWSVYVLVRVPLGQSFREWSNLSSVSSLEQLKTPPLLVCR